MILKLKYLIIQLVFHHNKSPLIFLSKGETTFNPMNNLLEIVIPYSLGMTNAQISYEQASKSSNSFPNYFYRKYFEL